MVRVAEKVNHGILSSEADKSLLNDVKSELLLTFSASVPVRQTKKVLLFNTPFWHTTTFAKIRQIERKEYNWIWYSEI